VPELGQAEFDALLVAAVIESNLPFNIVEKPTFRKLLKAGKARASLNIMTRHKVSKAVGTVYDKAVAHVVGAIAGRRLHIGFDLWSDPTGRGWLGVNGHFFNDDLRLLNVCLVFKYVPKTDSDAKHTGERIHDVLTAEINGLLGLQAGADGANVDYQQLFYSAIVDGGSNVGKAARLLVGATATRRCVMHALQTVLKYSIATIKPIAEAISAANYMASRSKTSQHFAQLVGKWSTGTKTRWNSYLRLASKIYEARTKLAAYSQNEERESAKFDVQFNVLHTGGFRVLNDVCSLLMPLMEITIDEEGERYITSSSVIPRLSSAIADMESKFGANRLDPPAAGFLRPQLVRLWEAPIMALLNTYLKPFYEDELLLCATLLDRRFGHESLSHNLLAVAVAALKIRLYKVHARLTEAHAIVVDEWRRAHELAQAPVRPPQREQGLDPEVAAARSAQVLEHAHDANLLNLLFGGGGGGDGDEALVGGPTPNFRSVDDEMKVLAKLPKLHGTADAMQVFRKDSPFNLVLAREVALDVLAAPAGEAPVERDFSVATHVLGKSRLSMAPKRLEQIVFAKRNAKALNFEL
jgi:hypothetical protein